MISFVYMNTATDNPGHGDTLRLLQVTDPHLSANIGRAMRGVDTYRSLQDVLDQTADLGWLPDAILATGDLVHDGTRQGYEHFRKLLGRFAARNNARVFTLPATTTTRKRCGKSCRTNRSNTAATRTWQRGE